MERKLLMQYSDLVHEREELKTKIQKLETEIEKIRKEGAVVDKVRGGEGGLQSFKIEGFPYPEYGKKKALLEARKDILSELDLKIMENINEIELFISKINDSHVRRIINLRIIEKQSWLKIAEKIGGGNTEDSVKKIFYRFIEKSESCPICPEKL